jgi:hypothetical protein
MRTRSDVVRHLSNIEAKIARYKVMIDEISISPDFIVHQDNRYKTTIDIDGKEFYIAVKDTDHRINGFSLSSIAKFVADQAKSIITKQIDVLSDRGYYIKRELINIENIVKAEGHALFGQTSADFGFDVLSTDRNKNYVPYIETPSIENENDDSYDSDDDW